MGAPTQVAKLLQLEERLKKAAREPDSDRAGSQLADVEGFGAERAQWLKVAAGAKAEVLAASLRGRELADTEIALELGGFVGYSASRLATSGVTSSRRRVISMEKNHGCALLANDVLNRAGLANDVEVWTGRASDLLPRVLEEYGEGSVGFAFFDHSGSAYLDDLLTLENHGLLGKNAVIVADNVLKPGAPLFLWHVVHGGKYDVVLVSVPEFVQTVIEDWVAVCVWRGESEKHPRKPLDRTSAVELSRLAWLSDAMRRRSERGEVDVAAWATFSQKMRLRYQQIGFEATPWQGLAKV